MLFLEMADDRLDGGAAFHLSFDGRRHATLLPGRVDFELVLGRRVVAAIAGIGVEPFDRISDELLDRRNDGCQGVAVIGITWERLRVGDELTALAVLEGGGNARFLLSINRFGIIHGRLKKAAKKGRKSPAKPGLISGRYKYAPLLFGLAWFDFDFNIRPKSAHKV
jgi:hypothetical protein